MNIIIPDIDQIIVSLTELPTLVNLGCVNKYFYTLVLNQPILKQWLIIKNMHGKKSIGEIFIEVCMKGFLSYGMFLLKKNKININASYEGAFRLSCYHGRIQVAQWLVQLGESGEYKRININANYEGAFRSSCYHGRIQVAQWLVQLGESGEYKRININANYEGAFRLSCENGHIQIAQWLIQLGESGEYKRIDINACNEDAFISSCANGHIQIAHWLIQLGESGNYSRIDQKIIDKYIKN